MNYFILVLYVSFNFIILFLLKSELSAILLTTLTILSDTESANVMDSEILFIEKPKPLLSVVMCFIPFSKIQSIILSKKVLIIHYSIENYLYVTY